MHRIYIDDVAIKSHFNVDDVAIKSHFNVDDVAINSYLFLPIINFFSRSAITNF